MWKKKLVHRGMSMFLAGMLMAAPPVNALAANQDGPVSEDAAVESHNTARNSDTSGLAKEGAGENGESTRENLLETEANVNLPETELIPRTESEALTEGNSKQKEKQKQKVK